jgi:hypothetical protein
MVGHSKGSAVIDVWSKRNPEFAQGGGRSRLYATPYDDPAGLEYLKDRQNEYQGAIDRKREMSRYRNPAEEWLEDGVTKLIASRLGLDGVVGMEERGEMRIANEGDPATMLDRSAERAQHGNPLAYLPNGGPHDWHEGIARWFVGFGERNMGDRPGGPGPSVPDPNYSRPVGEFSAPQTKTAPDTGPWTTLTE